MRSYSLFTGEVVSDKITIALPPSLRNTVEAECREAWKELNKIPFPDDSASPFIPYDELMRTVEGRQHFQMLNKMFYVPNSISGYPRMPYAKAVDLSELNLIMSRLQARRYNTQGRRKQVSMRAASAAEYRKFRSWWVSKYLAQGLGAEFSEPCPFEQQSPETPTESYIEMGKHFEEWTGHKLAKELWDELKKEEAKRLANKQLEAA